MKQIAMLLALVAISPWAFGQAYRCTDGEGRVTFSQYPCGAEAEAVPIDPRSRGIGVAPGGDWSATREANDRRGVARELERHQRILRRLMIRREDRGFAGRAKPATIRPVPCKSLGDTGGGGGLQ